MWVSGPEDLNSPAEWKWGYNRMTTVNGLFTAGDGVGASGHKFSSGSHTEGRIAAKNMVKWLRDHPGYQPVFKDDINAIAEQIYAPVRTYIEHKDKTMDEYVAGCSTYYQTNAKLLEMGLKYLGYLKEDSKKMRAKDLHELMRAWENYHRIITA